MMTNFGLKPSAISLPAVGHHCAVAGVGAGGGAHIGERLLDVAERVVEVLHLDEVLLLPLREGIVVGFFMPIPSQRVRRTTLSTATASSMPAKR